MKNLNLFLVLFALLFAGNVALGQKIERSVVATDAGTFITPNLTISYVIGEPVADLLLNPGNNVFLTTGFIQPDIELQQVLNMDITKSLVLYPNPVTGSTVKLAFNNLPDGTYTIDIIDPIGRVLQTQTVNYINNNFFYLPLDISQLKAGVYFIKVINSLNFQGKVKLIKI